MDTEQEGEGLRPVTEVKRYGKVHEHLALLS